MKFTASQLLDSIQQAIDTPPPPPRHRKQPAPKPATARLRAAAKPKGRPASGQVVATTLPGLATWQFLAAPYCGGTLPTEEAYERFKACAAANPATPWQQLLSSWCASESGESEQVSEVSVQEPEPKPEPETRNLTPDTPEPDTPPTGGGPLVSAITGLLVPRWQHPMLPPASRPLDGRELPVKETACFARLGDTWHPAEIIGMDANRTVSVIAGNAPHRGLPQHCVRLLVADDFSNHVLPVDFSLSAAEQVPVAPGVGVHTSGEYQDEDDMAGMPDWVRAMAEEGE